MSRVAVAASLVGHIRAGLSRLGRRGGIRPGSSLIIEPWLLAPDLSDLDQDSKIAADRSQALKRLRSLNSESVTAYQIIELKRTPNDPPSGLLRLILGLGHGFDHTARSLWRRNDDKLWNLI